MKFKKQEVVIMKFVFISDTHIGANPMGYQQQKGYPEKLPEIITALDKWIIERNDIEFVLHGGDMVDVASKENIMMARRLFKLSVPVYLCLGNHDMNKRDASTQWLVGAPDFFPNGTLNYSIKKDGVCIHVIPNQWDDIPYHWSDRQEPHFLDEQLIEIKKNVTADINEICFLCTHSPVFGVPMEQTGLLQDYHKPDEAFETEVMGIIDSYSSIRCVLSGHNHINTHVSKNNVHFISAGSFSEIPFEVKVFDVSGATIKMETISFLSEVGFKGEYDFNKTYVQGRYKDRCFKTSLV